MKEITQDYISQLKAGDIHIVYVYSTRCVVCQAFSPRLETIANWSPDIKVVKMNAEQNLDYMEKLDITQLPYFAIQDGPKFVGGDYGGDELKIMQMIKAIRELKEFRELNSKV